MSKQRFLVFLIFWLVSAPLVAQDFSDAGRDYVVADPFFFAGTTAGVSTPIGAFSDDYVYDPDASYALNGYVLNFAKINYIIHENYGFTARLSRHVFGMNDTKFTNDYNAAVPDFEWDISVENYQLTSAMAGLMIAVPNKWFTLQLNYSAGYGRGISPVQTYERLEISNQNLDVIVLEEAISSSLVLGLGVAIEKRIAQNIALIAHVEYISCTPDLSVPIFLNGTRVDSDNVEIKYRAIDAAIGFGLQL